MSDREWSWADVFLQNERALTAYATFLTGSIHDAEDLIHQVLVRIAKRGIRDIGDAKGYVLRALRNRAIQDHRARQRAQSHERSLAFLAPINQNVVAEPESVALREALAQLQPDALEVIVLKMRCDMSLRDIARAIDRPLGTVAGIHRRAIAELKEHLEREVLSHERA